MNDSNNSQFDSSLAGQRQQRIQKAARLRELGIDPYPAVSKRTHLAADAVSQFIDLAGQTVTVAGRITSVRGHGKLIFIDLADISGEIQLYIKQEEIEDTNRSTGSLGFTDLNLLDTYDIVEARGELTKTERGEISILVRTIRILTKALRPIPQELEDKEERFRRRYLDMQVHPEVRERFERRAKFWDAMRRFMNEKGFTEVNVPILEHVTGGADAKPFVTHFDALGEDLYLRISHELPLKRLIGAGFEKVYDIGTRFRNEGIDDEHLPEHVAMEWYWAFADWRDGMELTKQLFRFVLHEVYGTLLFSIRGFEIDLGAEWQEIDYVTIINDTYGIDIFTTPETELVTILKQHGVDFEGETNRPRLVDHLWKLIRKDIAGPAFLVGVPKLFSPLAKSNPDDPKITQRFHPIIAGSELANAYSELNDPIDQLDRFLEQQQMRDRGDAEAQMLDIDFVEMLEYGIPPTVGFGLSERVFWFFENVTAKEGVPFPQLRNTVDETTKKIYPGINFSIGEDQEKPARIATQSVAGGGIEKGLIVTQPAMSETNQELDYDPSKLPSRNAVLAFVEKYVQDEYQRHHAEMVETAMRAVARRLGQPEEIFGLTGLVHDWDFDKWPTEHPGHYEILREELGVPEDIIVAIEGHKTVSSHRPTLLAKTLFACDEFSGLLYAYMKMVGSYKEMKTSSIAKKVHKDLSFAAKINREDVTTGIAEVGIPEEEFFALIRDAFSEKYD